MLLSTTRSLLPLALLLAFAPALLAQPRLQAPSVDPLTGELVPFGFEAAPAFEATARGGDELEPVAYLPSGSTKLVRSLGERFVLFQDGGSLVTATVVGGEFVELDRFVLDAQPTDAVIVGDTVYVTLRKDRGLVILNMSDPEDITVIGRLEGRDLLSVTVDGNYAYAGEGTSGIVVYDVSDPANPVEVTTLALAGSSNGTFIDGSILYVATGSDGLRTFDLTSSSIPADGVPVGLSHFSTSGAFCTYVTVRDGVAWLTGRFGLIAADVSDPTTPVQLDTFSTSGETTYEIAFIGNTAFLPGLDGLRILDVTDPTAITQLAFIPANQALSTGVEPHTSTVYFAERFRGLYALDVSDPMSPVVKSQVRTAGFAYKMTFGGDLLYVTDIGGGLRIIDTSGAEAVELSRIDLPLNTQSVEVIGDHAYVTDADVGGTGLSIVDVSDPNTPHIDGGYNSPQQFYGLDVVSDGATVTVYLASDPGGLTVLDATDPNEVVELGNFHIPQGTMATDVEVRDGIAYHVSFHGGMRTLDVSDPTHITQLDTEPAWKFLWAISLAEQNGISVPGIAFTADPLRGLRLVDISDPTTITLIGTASPSSLARDAAPVYFQDELNTPVVYVADDFFGLREYYGVDAVQTGSFASGDRGVGVAILSDKSSEITTLVALAAGEAGLYFFEPGFEQTITSNGEGTTAGALALQTAFPNPVREAATLRFTLPEAADATLAVYDVLGRRVATLAEGTLAAGSHEAALDARGLPAGVYLARLTAGTLRATTRLVVVR